MKRVSCPYCGAKQSAIFLKSPTYCYRKCKSCELIFISDSRQFNSLENNTLYGYENQEQDYFMRESYYRIRAKQILTLIQQYKHKGQLLDIGSSYGILLDEAQKSGFKVHGIEYEKHAAIFAKNKFKLLFFNGSFEEWKTREKTKFDVITMVHVLEHVQHINNTINKIKTTLADDGITYIEVPNINSIMFWLTKKKWNWLLPTVHLSHFSKRSLVQILRENGFEIVHVSTSDDVSEFAYNIIDAFGIKKRAMLEKILWKLLRVTLLLTISLLSPMWSYFGHGARLEIIARKT